MQKTVGVIGAGISGMAAAIRLACKGYKVIVFEASSYPGGKLSEIRLGGYRFDAGPSLFTMPHFVDELFELASIDPSSHFTYEKLDIATHYFFGDGNTFKAYSDINQLASEMEKQLGEPGKNIRESLCHSEFLYESLADLFIHRPLHDWKTFVNWKAFKAYTRLHKLDLFDTMNHANEARFKQPKTVQVFNRYATYNGSNPYETPATMNIIPHLEFGVGAFLPSKGMHQITTSLFELAEKVGVEFHFNSKVEKINHEKGKVTGITVGSKIWSFDSVISNMDMVATYRRLLADIKAPERLLKQPKSSSALIFYWGIKKTFGQLGLHNIFFSEDYQKEFFHLFSKGDLYDDPTVYVNVTSKHVENDAPEGCENWFVMLNAPNNTGQDWEKMKVAAKNAVVSKLSRLLKEDIGSLIEEEAVLDPVLIESKTSSWQGALYGNSSNNRYAAFLRHPNKSRSLKHLYFCGGSVHPGGGIPLCLSSAKIVSGYFPSV